MINKKNISEIIKTALSTGGDFAEIFLEDKDELRINYKRNKVTAITTSRIKGVGIYILLGSRSVYLHTNDLSQSSLLETAKVGAEFLANKQSSNKLNNINFNCSKSINPNPIKTLPSLIAHNKKIDILKEITDYSYKIDKRVINMDSTYFDNDQKIAIYNSEGLHAVDRRINSKIRLGATVGQEGSYYDEWEDFTKAKGFEAFENNEEYLDFAHSFITSLVGNIDAVPFESCRVPVVFEGGNCGTFWHETCGHQLESYAIARNSSDFEGLIGQKVASDKVTLVDDGTIAGLYGSAAIDDEGNPTKRNVLIEKGILKGYLVDRLGGRLLNMPSTSSGRRQGYTFAPTSRMTNTYLQAGEDCEDEMISSVEKGVFVKKLGGGTGGREFSIAVKEGYLIEEGRITKRLKGLILNGRGIELIKKVDRVGKKLVTEDGSFCGASSGLCPVTSFQPRMRISNMFVGGK
ncbi:MAG: TldD/PmbA family protein [Tissierellia bacterium]|nr:TldD/PmbA family protein [Tissierellia bacterium]